MQATTINHLLCSVFIVSHYHSVYLVGQIVGAVIEVWLDYCHLYILFGSAHLCIGNLECSSSQSPHNHPIRTLDNFTKGTCAVIHVSLCGAVFLSDFPILVVISGFRIGFAKGLC